MFEGGERPRFSDRHVARLARSGFLAPDIVAAIMKGRQPAGLMARQLPGAAEIPMDWVVQRQVLGLHNDWLTAGAKLGDF